MPTTPKNKTALTLEDSALWQLAKSMSEAVRKVVAAVPYEDHYTFASTAIQNSTLTASDIAFAVGKGSDASLFDYHYARGHLFTAKGLLLMAQDLKIIAIPKSLLNDFDKLQLLIEHEIDRLEQSDATKKEGSR